MSTEATGNTLLDHLPAPARSDFLREAALASVDSGWEILAPGEVIRDLYFPTTAVCSVFIGLRSGQRAEVGTVGNEGFVGAPTVLGRDTSTEYAVVQFAGGAYTIGVGGLKRLQDKHPPLRGALLRYVAYALQVAKQSTACNAYHSLDQRLARWLLTTHDRTRSDEFRLTQELLAHMVAATRPRVSEATGRLRAAGIIDYQHGTLRVKDRKRLEAKACECYRATVPSEVVHRGR